MSDPSSYPDTDNDIDLGSGRASISGIPRWVKVSGIVVLVLVVLFAVMQLTGAGGHDPGKRGDHGLGDGAPDAEQEQVQVLGADGISLS